MCTSHSTLCMIVQLYLQYLGISSSVSITLRLQLQCKGLPRGFHTQSFLLQSLGRGGNAASSSSSPFRRRLLMHSAKASCRLPRCHTHSSTQRPNVKTPKFRNRYAITNVNLIFCPQASVGRELARLLEWMIYP